MLVRPCERADEGTVIGLAERLTIGVAPWRNPPDVREAVITWVRESLASEETVVLVAEVNGEVVGFVSVSLSRHWAGERDAYIGELVVDAEHEGRGIGSQLVSAAVGWASDREVARISVETGAANQQAREFYRALGFQEEEVRMSHAVPPPRKTVRRGTR